MKTVSEEACVKTWTGVVHLEKDCLPDLKQWREEFRLSVGDLFTLHGVEATIDGRLALVKGEVVLQVSKEMLIRLQPLKMKVQWDPVRKCPQAMTENEKAAYDLLCTRLREHIGPPPRVRIVGPIVTSGAGEPGVVAVREFVWE